MNIRKEEEKKEEIEEDTPDQVECEQCDLD